MDENTLKIKLSVSTLTSLSLLDLKSKLVVVQSQNKKQILHCPNNYGGHCISAVGLLRIEASAMIGT